MFICLFFFVLAREDADVDMSNDFTEETLTAATKEVSRVCCVVLQ